MTTPTRKTNPMTDTAQVDEIEGLRATPAAMTERLIDAAIYAESASGVYVGAARKEVNDARAAIEAELASLREEYRLAAEGRAAFAARALLAESKLAEAAEALRTSLSEMLEARDRLLCYHARTSGLDHGIEVARATLANLETQETRHDG